MSGYIESFIDGISAKTYSGCYGGEHSNVGDSIIVKIECPIYQTSMLKKQIIFLVDESGSMADTMTSVKASLFAARNSLLRLIRDDFSSMNENIKDEVFTDECNVSIITFSDDAYCRWESNAACIALNKSMSTISFSTAVNNIQAHSSTNMGNALIMAFEKKLPEYATWIVLLTDGISNKGPCQTVLGFKNLISRIPELTKIIPLGYTASFDPDVLSALGTMSYLDTEESIAETFGSIMGEIASCYGVDAKISLPVLSQYVNPNDLIVVPDTFGISRDIIGATSIGCLFNERKYIYGCLPWGDIINPLISQYHGLQGNMSYYDISRKIKITNPFIIQNGGTNVPDDVLEGYFESSKARIILGIYQAKKIGNFNKQYVNAIETKLNDWKHHLALTHKEEIFRVLNTQNSNRKEYVTAYGIASSAQSQTNYTNIGRHATTIQRISSLTATSDFNNYYNAPSSTAVTIDPTLADNTSIVNR